MIRSGSITVSGSLALPAIYAADIYETTLSVVNTGNQPVPLTTLSIAGAAFSLPAVPATPRQLAIGESLPFSVRFAPLDAGSFSGVLQAGTVTVFILGKSLPGATLFADNTAVHLPGAINFGLIETGNSASKVLTLKNPLSQPVTMNDISTSADYRLRGIPQTPFTLPPGSAVDFLLIAEPRVAGVLAGNLTIDSRQFPLIAEAFDHPLPIPSFLFQDSEVKSAQQSRLSIALSEPARASAKGSIEFAFELLTNGLAGDPGVMFPASGTRSLAFTVEPGDTLARFGAATFADFQTGTTAGNLVFRIRFGDYLKTAALTIAPDKIGVDHVRATRVPGELDLEIAGFDNTRTASKLTFAFFASDGTAVPPGAIPVDLAESFRNYFSTASLGGMFSLRAAFPVSGAADKIAGVELDLVNSQGTTHTQRVSF